MDSKSTTTFPISINPASLGDFDRKEFLLDVRCTFRETLEYNDKPVEGARSRPDYFADIDRGCPLIGDFAQGHFALGSKKDLKEIFPNICVLSEGDNEFGILKTTETGQHEWFTLDWNGQGDLPSCPEEQPNEVRLLFSHVQQIHTWHRQRFIYVPNKLFIYRLAWIFSSPAVNCVAQPKKGQNYYKLVQKELPLQLRFFNKNVGIGIQLLSSNSLLSERCYVDFKTPMMELEWEAIPNPDTQEFEAHFKATSIKLGSSLWETFFCSRSNEAALTALCTLVWQSADDEKSAEIRDEAEVTAAVPKMTSARRKTLVLQDFGSTYLATHIQGEKQEVEEKQIEEGERKGLNLATPEDRAKARVFMAGLFREIDASDLPDEAKAAVRVGCYRTFGRDCFKVYVLKEKLNLAEAEGRRGAQTFVGTLVREVDASDLPDEAKDAIKVDCCSTFARDCFEAREPKLDLSTSEGQAKACDFVGTLVREVDASDLPDEAKADIRVNYYSTFRRSCFKVSVYVKEKLDLTTSEGQAKACGFVGTFVREVDKSGLSKEGKDTIKADCYRTLGRDCLEAVARKHTLDLTTVVGRESAQTVVDGLVKKDDDLLSEEVKVTVKACTFIIHLDALIESNYKRYSNDIGVMQKITFLGLIPASALYASASVTCLNDPKLDHWSWFQHHVLSGNPKMLFVKIGVPVLGLALIVGLVVIGRFLMMNSYEKVLQEKIKRQIKVLANLKPKEDKEEDCETSNGRSRVSSASSATGSLVGAEQKEGEGGRIPDARPRAYSAAGMFSPSPFKVRREAKQGGASPVVPRLRSNSFSPAS